MKQDYFYHNGNKITSGTILKFKPYCIDPFWKLYTEEVTFIWYEPGSEFYYIQVNNRKERIPKEKFEYYFIKSTFKLDMRFINQVRKMDEKPTMSFKEELQIDDMLLAWICFIFLMGLTFIFKGFYFYWTVIIIVFACYRSGKLNQNKYNKRR